MNWKIGNCGKFLLRRRRERGQRSQQSHKAHARSVLHASSVLGLDWLPCAWCTTFLASDSGRSQREGEWTEKEERTKKKHISSPSKFKQKKEKRAAQTSTSACRSVADNPKGVDSRYTAEVLLEENYKKENKLRLNKDAFSYGVSFGVFVSCLVFTPLLQRTPPSS